MLTSFIKPSLYQVKRRHNCIHEHYRKSTRRLYAIGNHMYWYV